MTHKPKLTPCQFLYSLYLGKTDGDQQGLALTLALKSGQVWVRQRDLILGESELARAVAGDGVYESRLSFKVALSFFNSRGRKQRQTF